MFFALASFISKKKMIMPSVLIIITVLLSCGLFTLIAVLIMKTWDRKGREPLRQLDGQTVEVPLVAAFSRIKRIPFLAMTENSLNPRLVLHSDHLEYRVLRTKRYRYEEVEAVDIRLGMLRANLVLKFSNSRWAFYGNMRYKEKLAAVLRILEKKCTLTVKARNFLQEQEDAGKYARRGATP